MKTRDVPPQSNFIWARRELTEAGKIDSSILSSILSSHSGAPQPGLTVRRTFRDRDGSSAFTCRIPALPASTIM